MSLHIAPSRGWINDPNGLAFRHGRWHVFFQHNPVAPVHGEIHWGHVSSPDLATWTEHPVAFGPRPGAPDANGCWSGVVTDAGDHGAALYTSVHDRAENSTVSLRWALDADLLTWSEPIVVAETPAEVWQMRDPFVFCFGGRRFAVLGAGLADGRAATVLYRCDDLLDWHYAGLWLTSDTPGAQDLGPANIWECPQLVRFENTWVLIVSLWHDHVLGRVEYLTLDLTTDPRTGAPVPSVRGCGPVDLGTAYAPQVLALPGEAPLMISWVRHPGLPNAAPQAEPPPVAGSLGLPCRLTLTGERLTVSPEPTLTEMFGPARDVARLPAIARVRGPGLNGARLTGAGIDACLPADSAELWLDGEVAEVFTGGPSLTMRADSAGWSLTPTGPVDVCEPA